jgi:hypothetical protein
MALTMLDFTFSLPLLRILLSRIRGRWGDPAVDGRIILGWIFKKCWCEDWIGVAQDRDRWRALVSAVRNLRVP